MLKGKEIQYYLAFKSKDVRFDGRFFVGVKSTGIYCRPVCRAKKPKEENCTFFETAAEAEQAGFRPCLQCRPELAPGLAPVDSTAVLAQKAARILEENCSEIENLQELAERLGCSDRHLRRAFATQYNVSPVQYMQTCRLLLAKSLLTDTGLSVLEAAMVAGFGSLRRFNDLFLKQYHLSPTQLRKQATTEKNQFRDTITLKLGYRPPYMWKQILDFLSQRAIQGVEKVEDGEYYRTVRHVNKDKKTVCGWIKVGNIESKNVLSLTVSASLISVLPQVLSKVKRLFDLYCEPQTVYETLEIMNDIKENLCMLGIRLPGCFDDFELCVRAVLGQQITVKAATTLAGRFVKTFGEPIETQIEGLCYTFPTPESLLELKGEINEYLGPLGIISTRAKTILELARLFNVQKTELAMTLNPEEEIKKLTEIPGIGQWTAQYIAMRACGWADAFLETDHGVKKVLAPRTQKEILELAESWRPFRAYAVMNLWNSLD